MLRSCGRAVNPLRRLAGGQARGYKRGYNAYRVPRAFDYKITSVPQPSGNRVSDQFEIALQQKDKQKSANESLDLACEVCAAQGPQALSPRFFGELLENIYEELRAVPVAQLKEYPTESLKRLDDIFPHVVGLQAYHYTFLIQIAHMTRRHRLIQDVWEQAMLSGCDKTTKLYNAYLKARMDSSPASRGEGDFPDNRKANFWVQNRGTSRQGQLDPLEFMQEMRENGCEPSGATYAMTMDYYGQLNNLPMTINMCEQLWGVGFESGKLEREKPEITSATYPTSWNLIMVIDAFGSNDRLVEGKAYCEKIAEIYNICLTGEKSQGYWAILMRHALYTAIPYGQTPPDLCNTLWNQVVEFSYPPSPQQYSIRIRDLLVRERLEDCETLMHYAITVDVDGELVGVVYSYLKLLVLKYTKTGNISKAIEVAETFADYPQKYPQLQFITQLIANLKERALMSGNGGLIDGDGGELDLVNDALVQELKYIPEDDEEEENFLQL